MARSDNDDSSLSRCAPIWARTGILAAIGAFLTGCLSPIAMHRAVIEYDRTTSRVEAELLLLNIARARHYRPVHFTFDFRVSAGISGSIGWGVDPDQRPLTLDYSTTVAENPTIIIIPITGEEFTKRILRPFEESHFEFLAHQGSDINMVLRLMARSISLKGKDSHTVLVNARSRNNNFTPSLFIGGATQLIYHPADDIRFRVGDLPNHSCDNIIGNPTQFSCNVRELVFLQAGSPLTFRGDINVSFVNPDRFVFPGSIDFSFEIIPEPSSLLLFGSGPIGLRFLRKAKNDE